MALTTTDYATILKEFYLDLFEEQYNRQTVVMDEVIFKRDSQHVEGKKAYIAVEWETWAGTGSRAEEGTLPEPQSGEYNRIEVPMRHHYAAFRITGQTIEASANNPGAFAPAMQREMKSKITAFLKHENRQFLGDGSGVICMVDGAPAATAITVDNAYGVANAVNGHMFMSKNVQLEAWSAKSGGSEVGDLDVESVTKGSGTTTSAIINVTSDPGCSDNDYIFIRDARGIEFMGLLGIIDDASYVSTLYGINRATGNDVDFRGQVRTGATAGTNEALTLKRMQLLWNDCVFTGGGKPLIILGSPSCVMTYAMMAKREGVVVNKMQLDSGWTGVDFNAQAIVLADPYCPSNMFFYIDPTTFRLYELARPRWIDRGTGIMKQVGRTDVWEAQYMHYAELGCSKPMASGVLRDITELS